jgi:hypothetical protein
MKDKVLRLMRDICPWKIGDTVVVKRSHQYADDFRGVWIITGMRWEYQRGDGKINIEIASENEILHGHGATDCWSVDDFEPARSLP